MEPVGLLPAAQLAATTRNRRILPGTPAAGRGSGKEGGVENARQVRDAFTSFVGQTFFSQMIGAMRTSVGKPAYFHGGQAEEIFRGQLDQQLAEKMAETTRARFGGPMFAHQFPQLAQKLATDETTATPRIDASGLDRLSRR